MKCLWLWLDFEAQMPDVADDADDFHPPRRTPQADAPADRIRWASHRRAAASLMTVTSGRRRIVVIFESAAVGRDGCRACEKSLETSRGCAHSGR